MARSNRRGRPSPEARREMDAREDVARQDMALGLAALVRSAIRLRHGERRAYIEGLRQTWNGGAIEISGPEIDADDLGVLLALLAIAGRDGGESKPGGDVPGLLPSSARAGENVARQSTTITVRTTMAEICREAGRDPGTRTRRAVRDSIRRLAAITITAEAGDGVNDDPPWALTHLLAGAVGRGRGPVELTLSYRLTRAVACDGSYGRLRMAVWRRLSPTAQVAYHWLACWYGGADGRREIGLDTLAAHVWGIAATNSQLRDRRRKLKLALAEMPSDEWSVVERAGRGATILQITRERVIFATQKGDLRHAPMPTIPAMTGAAA